MSDKPPISVIKKDLEILSYCLDLLTRQGQYELAIKDSIRLHEKSVDFSKGSDDVNLLAMLTKFTEDALIAREESFKKIKSRVHFLQSKILLILEDIQHKSDTFVIDDLLKEIYKQ